MLKSNIKREEEDNLKVHAAYSQRLSPPASLDRDGRWQDEIRISLLVGSHPHIVYMKEFIENADK